MLILGIALWILAIILVTSTFRHLHELKSFITFNLKEKETAMELWSAHFRSLNRMLCAMILCLIGGTLILYSCYAGKKVDNIITYLHPPVVTIASDWTEVKSELEPRVTLKLRFIYINNQLAAQSDEGSIAFLPQPPTQNQAKSKKGAKP